MSTAPPPSTSPPSAPAGGGLVTAKGATFAVVVLTMMNLLNYIDRWVPSAVKELFKKDLQLTDQQTSLPFSAFVIVYMLASPIFGSLAETRSRRHLVAFGVGVWSLATAAASLAQGFTMFLVCRALVGVGEAAYATIAPSWMSDFFPPAKRNRVFTIFYVAMPVGAALGFAVGGLLGEHFGWRAAFLACGLPGLLVAALSLLIEDPPRGRFDDPGADTRAAPWREVLPRLLNNRVYRITVGGYVLVSFASGAIGEWFAAFLERERGMSTGAAGFWIGVVTVVGGLGGTVLGGIVADRVGKTRVRQPYLVTSGVAVAFAALFAGVGLFGTTTAEATLALVLVSQLFLWAYNGPINALIVNSVEPGMRVRAFGLSILAIHIFGDVPSPLLVGFISDTTHSLGLGLVLVPASLLLGAFVWLVGAGALADVPVAPLAKDAGGGS